MIAQQHEAWSERYEALRAEALSGDRAAARERGLLLLLRYGVASWMAAWQRMAPAPSRPPALTPAPRIATGAGDLRRQLAGILADLVIRTHGGKAV